MYLCVFSVGEYDFAQALPLNKLHDEIGFYILVAEGHHLHDVGVGYPSSWREKGQMVIFFIFIY